jgi:hypothetical protein
VRRPWLNKAAKCIDGIWVVDWVCICGVKRVATVWKVWRREINTVV